MDYGLHLPLMDFSGNPFSLGHLIIYAETAQKLGFSVLAANDHLVYSKPWLDVRQHWQQFSRTRVTWTWSPQCHYRSYAVQLR
jgi:hypothetical protein